MAGLGRHVAGGKPSGAITHLRRLWEDAGRSVEDGDQWELTLEAVAVVLRYDHYEFLCCQEDLGCPTYDFRLSLL